METVLIGDKEKPEWESFIERNPYAIAWQSYDWRDVLARHYRFDFHPLAVYESGKIIGVLPLYRLKTAFAKDSLNSVPYAVAGGVVSDSEEARNLLIGKAVEISKAHNSCGIVLKQYKVRMPGDFQTDENYYNRELDISRGSDEIRKGFSDRNRDMIESRKKSPCVLEYPSADLAGFFRMLLRHLHANGVPCVGRKWIEDLLRFKMYSIALLRINGRLVAGTLVKEFKKTASFPFTCLREGGGPDNRAAYRLYWELMKYFSGKGFEIIHSGRIPNNDATDDYRLGWGGTKHGYYYQYYPNRGGKTEYDSRRGRKREILERCWKLLPTPVAGAIGPLVVRRFP